MVKCKMCSEEVSEGLFIETTTPFINNWGDVILSEAVGSWDFFCSIRCLKDDTEEQTRKRYIDDEEDY